MHIKGITIVECNACSTSKAKQQIRRFPREINKGLRLGKRVVIDFYDFEEDKDKYNSLMLITDQWLRYM